MHWSLPVLSASKKCPLARSLPLPTTRSSSHLKDSYTLLEASSMVRWARMPIRNASYASSYKSHYPCIAYAWLLAMTTLRSASLKVKRYFKWQELMTTNPNSFQRWQAFRQFKSHVVSITSHQWTRMVICTHGAAPQFNKIADSLAMETSRVSSSLNVWLLSRNIVSSKLLVEATIL